MTILVAIWSIQIGGAETFAVDLCAYLKNKGHKPYLFPILSNWDRKFYSSIKSKNVKVVSPFTNPTIDWLAWKVNQIARLIGFNFREWLSEIHFRRLLKIRNIQVIVTNGLIADDFVETNLNSKVPFIVVEHGEYCISIIDNLPVNPSALKSANTVVAVSKWCQKNIEQQLKVKTMLIYNGLLADHINDLPASNNPSQRFSFCMIGRGTAYKGWEEAICAFIKFHSIYPNCELKLIGGGEELDILKDKFSNYEGVQFLGRVVNPLDHLADADVGLVLSRKYEAFGLVLLNFFHLAKPVIATRVGAIPEVANLDGNPAGILVNVNEDGRANESELIAAMLTLYEDENKRKEYGRRAQEIAGHFSFEKTGMAYEKLITKVVAEYNYG